jgi:carbonic anhydrase/acetyltransferase-like protein (isoleucine patch superfamily)
MTIESYLNHKPNIDPQAWVHPQALVIGKVTIGANSSVWPRAIIRGDVQHIEIGKKCNIQDGCIIHVTHDSPWNPGGFPTLLADHITVGHAAILHGCKIEDHCLIGIGSTILDGAHIEAETLIGANTLVTAGQKLSGKHLWLGQPARKIRALTTEELKFLHYSAEHYAKIKHHYTA